MSFRNQYLGFLRSKPLTNITPQLGIPAFDFEELSRSSLSANDIEISMKDNEVLGKRIERFFEYGIENSDRYQMIAKNIQVFKGKITIGELDFIIKDLYHKKTIHVELVYKFYLYDPDINPELHRWIGPNRKDSLLQKVEKLKNKQFSLLYDDEVEAILEDFQLYSAEIEQQVCYLANLFIPFSRKKIQPQQLDHNCIVGYWMNIKEFASGLFESFHFYMPEKKDWIVDPKYNQNWFSFTDILRPLNEKLNQKKSPLLWVKSNEDSYTRFFIVWW